MGNERVALIDVCDVVVDLKTTTIQVAQLDIPPERRTEWDIFNIISPEECVRVMKLFDDPEYWRHLPPVPGSYEGVEGLRALGYDIHWVTSPWYTCHNWENVRRAWLKEYFGTGPLDITFTSEKFRFDGDIFIDDRPKHVKLWHAKRPQNDAWIFDTDFNRFFDWSKRCTWSSSGIQRL